jgi:hypothetical protein
VRQAERLALPHAERARDLIDLGPVSTTALIGLPRVALRGCSTFDCRTCWGRSGDALINSQFSPSALTARLAWVRVRTRASPAHAKRHVAQRHFH